MSMVGSCTHLWLPSGSASGYLPKSGIPLALHSSNYPTPGQPRNQFLKLSICRNLARRLAYQRQGERHTSGLTRRNQTLAVGLGCCSQKQLPFLSIALVARHPASTIPTPVETIHTSLL
jgi:hypothetical protein